ncbi:MAG: hypothetical protein NVSMB46_07290 [Candidatus Saccharimonadales bacterium]
MISALLSLYRWSFSKTIIYMLQSTEYQVWPYLKWFWRTQDYSKVMKRRSLDKTSIARGLLLVMRIGIVGQILLGIFFIVLWKLHHTLGYWEAGLSILLSYPIIWSHLIVVPLLFGKYIIVQPREKRYINESFNIFKKHKGIKIAVAGSYGKTSMKEILLTVLSEGKRVVATPANKNVASSHAYFARTLRGDEEIIILEYGEGKPGDVQKFSSTTQPNMAIITGLAPAHLDHYPTLEDAGKDIMSVASYLHNKEVYINGDSPALVKYIHSNHHSYTSKGLDNWTIKNIKLTSTGTSFDLSDGQNSLHLESGLLGNHQVGPLALAAVIAFNVGLTKKHIEEGIKKTVPYEHRMQPRMINGACIIDDTYNGNIDGMRAGLELLHTLPAKRKIYVTPGLVDQGIETKKVHVTLGKLIAQSNPDKVILMENSVTDFIKQGLEKDDFKGTIEIESNPLEFYTNMHHFIASGDLIMMQNDWTDNYA